MENPLLEVAHLRNGPLSDLGTLDVVIAETKVGRFSFEAASPGASHHNHIDRSSQNGDIQRMARTIARGERPLDWVGSSKRDLLAFPEPVKGELGNALGVAQFGGKHPAAKPWKGQGPGVLEIVEDHDGDTYRAVYTVRFKEVVYVLHAFQKKSPKGIKTAQADVELVGKRLRLAQQDHEARYGKPKS